MGAVDAASNILHGKLIIALLKNIRQTERSPALMICSESTVGVHFQV